MKIGIVDEFFFASFNFRIPPFKKNAGNFTIIYNFGEISSNLSSISSDNGAKTLLTSSSLTSDNFDGFHFGLLSLSVMTARIPKNLILFKF